MRKGKTRGKLRLEGWIYASFTTLVGLLAVSTGSNLIFASFSFLLALFVASGVISTLNLSGLSLEFSFPREIYKGQRFLLSLKIKRGGFIPSLGLTGRFSIEGREYLFDIPSSKAKETRVSLSLKPQRRGRHTLQAITLSSSFPLGFVRREKEILKDLEFLVFPSIRDVDFPPEGEKEEDSYKGLFSQQEGIGGDFLGLRVYNPGDSLKMVFWKAATRSHPLMVKQFSRETLPKRVTLRLPPSPREEDIDNIASQAVSAIRKGFGVGLEMPGRTLEIDYGDPQRKKILTYLALYPFRGEDRG